jgi:glycosyltransferase involved in cell wall biosynthesis
MNVLLVYTSLDIGGAEKHVVQLAVALKNAGMGVAVAAQDGYYKEELLKAGIPFYSLSLYGEGSEKKKSLIGYVRSFFRLFRVIDGEMIDVLHAHARYISPISWLAARIRRKKYVMSVHNCFTGYRRLSVWGRNLIVGSERVKTHLLNYFGLKSKNIYTIPYGCVPLDSPSDVEVEGLFGGLGLPRECIAIGCIGRLEPSKGQYYLIAAMPKVLQVFSNVRLLIVGDGSERRTLEEEVQSLRIKEYVHFLGVRSDEATIIGGCFILVVPSTLEGFPLVILESSSLGKACVASDVGGISDFVQNQSTGLLVPPGDSDAISEALIYAVRHPDEVQRMGERAKQLFADRFLVQRMVNETLTVYRSLH